ncbi:MAG: MATE family efflux transporter [Eubacterium sp.]|nr:MATE family efflux transporter [Eubacterium sp.]
MGKNDTQYQKMLSAPVPKLVISLAVPTMVSMLVTSIYNVADAYFVSKLGTYASGAVGIVFSLMAMIQAIGFTVGMGAGSAISRLLGKKETDKAQKIASSAFALSILSGGAFCIFGVFFLEKLMVWLGATESILPYAKEYARYILYVAPVMTASFVLNNLLRAEGKTKLSMIGILGGSILNIALDPLFIFAFGFGIQGAAAATAVSQCVGFVILLFFFIRKKTILRLSFKNLSADVSLYREFIANGMPSFFRQGLASVSSIALNRVAAGYSDAAVAAMSIVGKVFLMVYCVLIGFGQGYQPAAGYNFGAKEYGRVRQAYRFLMIAGTVGMTCIGAALFWAAPLLLKQFIPEDAKVIEIGIQALRMQCVVMPLLTLGIACNMTFQAVGQSVKATVLASLRQGIFFLPFIWVLPRLFGIYGMEAAQPAADAATFLVCVPVIWKFIKDLKKAK